MQDIGELLSKTREEKGLEIDQVARETNILRHYLEGLEKDDYTVFPAEPYVLGFLRIYCDYLGLNSDEVIQSYKQIQVQETDVPHEILLPKKSVFGKSFLIGLGILVLVAAVGFGGYWLIGKLLRRKKAEKNIGEKEATERVITSREATTYEIENDSFEKRLFEADSFKFTIGEKTHTFTVKKASPELELETPVGVQIVKLGEKISIDLDEDAYADLEIAVTDLDKDDGSKGVLIMVLSGEALSSQTEPVDVGAQNDSLNTKKKYKVIFDGASAYPVTANFTFRGYCFFRYEIDSRERKERYYQKNEGFTVQANNGFRIWASNGNAVKIQLVAGGKTVDLDVSRPGEVIVQDLKWIKDTESGRFKFVVIEVD
ncbi:MAG: transcriptional regulator [Treponema sp.]|nr:MAG: transcriptional regulator [Treponema sp.]